MAMKEEDKLTKDRVIADVKAIIQPPSAKANGGSNRGDKLLREMLSRANEERPQQTRQARPVTTTGRPTTPKQQPTVGRQPPAQVPPPPAIPTAS